MAFKLTVDGFTEKNSIPCRFTCDGEGTSPALHWTGEPAETKSFALIMDDPDAPGGTWNHWLIWDIPAEIHSLPEGNGHSSPVGTPGTNDFGRRGYGGPCPPKGSRPHRYFFRMFALDTATLDLVPHARRPVLEKALRKHALAETEYMGRYARG